VNRAKQRILLLRNNCGEIKMKRVLMWVHDLNYENVFEFQLFYKTFTSNKLRMVWKGFCEVVQCVSCLVLLDGTVRRRCRYSMTTCPAWDQTITLMMSSLDRSQERFLSFINTFDRLFLWWVAALKLLHVCASIRPLSSVDHCLIRESIQFVSSSCCLLTFFTCICFDLCALKLKEYFLKITKTDLCDQI